MGGSCCSLEPHTCFILRAVSQTFVLLDEQFPFKSFQKDDTDSSDDTISHNFLGTCSGVLSQRLWDSLWNKRQSSLCP